MGRKKGGKDKAAAGKRPRKLFVEFDAEARREYVTGMHRRKQQRKEKAIMDLKKQVEKERKEARDERRATLLDRRDKQSKMKELRKAENEDLDDDGLQGLAADSDEDASAQDDQQEEDEEQKGAQNMVSQLTGQKAVVQEEQVDDEFSKNMFGSGMVTVTTTTLGDDDEEDEDEMDAKTFAASKTAAQPVALLGDKNMEYTPGKAERMLQRLQHKKNRRAHAKSLVGGSKNSKAKITEIMRGGNGKKGKSGKKNKRTTAKERRRRT